MLLVQVRTCCTKPDLHVDYSPEVGTTALTLMTPLYSEFTAVEDFQLLYESGDNKKLRRYRYRLGEAIAFGAGFVHSTEPGSAAALPAETTAQAAKPEFVSVGNDSSNALRRAHAYLCFTFGSNHPDRWASIAETIDGQQSRQISRPAQLDGGQRLSLSKLGLRIEAGTADQEAGEGSIGRMGLSGEGRLASGPQVASPQIEGGHRAEVAQSQRRMPRGILK